MVINKHIIFPSLVLNLKYSFEHLYHATILSSKPSNIVVNSIHPMNHESMLGKYSALVLFL